MYHFIQGDLVLIFFQNVRRLALLTINSAIHRKPYLIRDVLSQLIPLLYDETVVKEELIHTVEMGPFKHKVDDGLEIRKVIPYLLLFYFTKYIQQAAYECMYTLLNSCLDKIDVYGFLDRVRVGLDDQHDIKMLAYLMLIRLGKVAPTAVTQSKYYHNQQVFFESIINSSAIRIG